MKYVGNYIPNFIRSHTSEVNSYVISYEVSLSSFGTYGGNREKNIGGPSPGKNKF